MAIKATKDHIHVISNFTRRTSNTLFRSPEEIGKLIDNFFIEEDEDEGYIPIGCIGYKIWGNDAEIIGLFIEDDYRQRGIASHLFFSCIDEIKQRPEIDRLFALATPDVAEKFFLNSDFQKVGIQMFGPKVVRDCMRCKKNKLALNGKYLCNEIALLYTGK